MCSTAETPLCDSLLARHTEHGNQVGILNHAAVNIHFRLYNNAFEEHRSNWERDELARKHNHNHVVLSMRSLEHSLRFVLNRVGNDVIREHEQLPIFEIDC